MRGEFTRPAWVSRKTPYLPHKKALYFLFAIELIEPNFYKKPGYRTKGKPAFYFRKKE